MFVDLGSSASLERPPNTIAFWSTIMKVCPSLGQGVDPED